MKPLIPVLGVSLLAIGCSDDNNPCDPVANTGCEGGQACEVVTGGEPACFAPVLMRGEVIDLADGSPIDGARVVALDVNGAPRSSVAVTDADGNYELRIPTERTDGEPVSADLSLRVDAAGYQSFPGGVRQAIPIDTGAAVEQDGGALVVESALTSVGLVALPDAGEASLTGRVQLAEGASGVLVVAELGTEPGDGYSAIADANGDYAIFNLPAGDYTVRGFAQGSNYVAETITLDGTQTGEVDLSLSETAASAVSGTVTLVEGATPTSVILVVASTFDDVLKRGETPPGLRAPDPGIAPNIDGAFTIAGVPEGRYVALAAFENDGAVRDQSDTGNTALVFIDVVAGEDLPLETSFKVTEAIVLVGPGADEPEEVASAPTLAWEDDPSAKDYHVQVFDALGNLVMDHHTLDGAVTSIAYDGPLDAGMYYQLRVTSYDDASPTPNPIANTEDLRGVFFVP